MKRLLSTALAVLIGVLFIITNFSNLTIASDSIKTITDDFDKIGNWSKSGLEVKEGKLVVPAFENPVGVGDTWVTQYKADTYVPDNFPDGTLLNKISGTVDFGSISSGGGMYVSLPYYFIDSNNYRALLLRTTGDGRKLIREFLVVENGNAMITNLLNSSKPSEAAVNWYISPNHLKGETIKDTDGLDIPLLKTDKNENQVGMTFSITYTPEGGAYFTFGNGNSSMEIANKFDVSIPEVDMRNSKVAVIRGAYETYYDDLTIEYIKSGESETEAFLNEYSDVLSLTTQTVKPEHKTRIIAALDAYALLSPENKDILSNKKNLLDSLLNVIDSDINNIVDTFDSGTGNWGTLVGDGKLAAENGFLNIPACTSIYSLNNWPDKELKSAVFDMKAKIQGATNLNACFIYYYENENNYKYLRIRETGTGVLFIAKGVVTDKGLENDTTSMGIAENEGSIAGQYSNTNISLKMEQGVTITIEYLSSSEINFSIVNNEDSALKYETTITASSNTNFLKATEQSNNIVAIAGDTHNGIDIKFNTIAINFAATNASQIAQEYQNKHSEVLNLTSETVEESHKAKIQLALDEWEKLGSDVQALLTAEKAILDDLNAKIEMLELKRTGYYIDNFEYGNTWQSLKDPADDWGVANNPQKDSLNSSDKVFLPLGSMPTEGKDQNDHLWTKGHIPAYAPNNQIWDTMKDDKLYEVSGDFYLGARGWQQAAVIYYWYQDAENYKAIILIKQEDWDMHQNRQGTYTYHVRHAIAISGNEYYESFTKRIGTIEVDTTEDKWVNFSLK